MNTALEILKSIGAIITDSHLVYTSGRHGSVYINKDKLYLYPYLVFKICDQINRYFLGKEVDIVVGPAIGGAILAQWTAYLLGKKMSAFAENVGEPGGPKKMIFKRGYDKEISGKNVLIVEDILTTGGSAKAVVEAVKKLGGNIVGMGVVCNRGGVGLKDLELEGGQELFSLASIQLLSWPEVGCPLCEAGIPINTDVGKGREFLARKGEKV